MKLTFSVKYIHKMAYQKLAILVKIDNKCNQKSLYTEMTNSCHTLLYLKVLTIIVYLTRKVNDKIIMVRLVYMLILTINVSDISCQ